MIYSKNNIYKKELKEIYFEKGISKRKRIEHALFVSLLSFGIHLIIVSLSRSVLSDAIPQFVTKSYFSLLAMYINIIPAFYVFYFTVNYQYLTFAEIKENKWYVLIKFGFSSLKMTLAKIITRIYSIAIVYTLGFIFVVLWGSLLKYDFILQYAVGLYILGFTDIFILTLATMTLSLYLRKNNFSSYYIILSLIILGIIKHYSGYYNVLNENVSFISTMVISTFAYFLLIIIVIALACLAIIIIQAEIDAKYYFFSFYRKDLDFADDIKVVVNPQKHRPSIINKNKFAISRPSVFSAFINLILSAFIVCSIAINVMILFLSISSPGREIAIFGQIPMVFKSETMEPTIMYNDLALFTKVNEEEKISVSDIVLFKDNNEISVSRVKSINNNILNVDIDKYPLGSNKLSLKKHINRGQIYGKYSGRSRWLGAIILFANTPSGRLILLLLPTILLFYFRPINNFFRHISDYSYKRD